jgi:site-specific DNA-methyltransferase (adenine-specific)
MTGGGPRPERLAGGLVELYAGDCLAALPLIPDGSVDLILADPPYSSGGQFRGDRAADPVTKYVRGNTGATASYSTFDGDTRDQRAYGYWCALWLGECLRAAKPGAVCGLFTDWRQLPATVDALQAGGFVYRGIVPWDKTEAARPAKGRYRNQCEYIVWGSAGSMGTEVAADDDRPCLPGLFRQSVVGVEKEHIAAKPVKLIRGLIQICPPGGRILDPFAGSGTAAVAALIEGRRGRPDGAEPDPPRHHPAAGRRGGRQRPRLAIRRGRAVSDLIRVLVDVWVHLWPFRVVHTWQRGVYYVAGRYWRTVPPGVWPVVPFFTDLRPVDVVAGIWATPLQTITLRDGRALTYSAMITVRVEDAAAALNLVMDWSESTLELVSGILSERLADAEPERFDPARGKRDRLLEAIRAAADDGTRAFGVRVDAVRFSNFAVGVRTLRLLTERATPQGHFGLHPAP